MVDFSKRAIHVMVSPELKTTYVVQCLGGMERFRMFIDECLADAGSDLLKTPDSMLFRYVMDAEKVPGIDSQDNADYFKRLLAVTEPLDIHPTHIVPLREAAYCVEKGIPPLSPDSAHRFVCPAMERETLQADKYNIGNSFPVYKYVKTNTEALLFTRSPEGRKAYRKYLQTIAEGMFSENRQGQVLRIVDIPANMIARWDKHRYLPGRDCYQPPENMERDGIVAHEQILEPTPASLQLFVERFAGEEIYMPQKAYDYASLMSAGTSAMEAFQEYGGKTRFSYEPVFRSLNRRIALCDDSAQKAALYTERKRLAEGILERDFHDYRHRENPIINEIATSGPPLRQSRSRRM